MDGDWKFQGGEGRERGSQKPKLLKESMCLNWNFWEGRRVGGWDIQTKKTYMSEVWIFPGTTR